MMKDSNKGQLASLKGRKSLLANLFLLDKCCNEYSEAVDQLVTYLVNYRDYVLTQLQTEKRKLEGEIWEAISEVESTLSDESPVLKNPLSITLRDFGPGKLSLFQYNVDVTKIVGIVETILGFKISELNLLSEEFPKPIVVMEEKVLFFEPTTGQWNQLFTTPKIRTDYDSASTLIGDNSVFVCGGGNYVGECCNSHVGNSAYILGDGLAQEIQMFTPRSSPGIIYDSNRESVYIFGGNTTNKKGNLSHRCEKFMISSSHWEMLPSMNATRRSFNPCMHSSLVYLCGGFANLVETYDPQINDFTRLPCVELLFQGNLSTSTAIVESDNLVMVSRDSICKMNLTKKKLTQTEKHIEYDQGESEYRCPWSNSSPVVSDGICYVVDLYRKMCRGIDLRNGKIVKEVRLP